MDHIANMAAVLDEGVVPAAAGAGIGSVVVEYASRSQPGVWHRCSYSPGTGFRCTCRGMQFHRRCWHVTDLRARLAGWGLIAMPATSAAAAA